MIIFLWIPSVIHFYQSYATQKIKNTNAPINENWQDILNDIFITTNPTFKKAEENKNNASFIEEGIINALNNSNNPLKLNLL